MPERRCRRCRESHNAKDQLTDPGHCYSGCVCCEDLRDNPREMERMRALHAQLDLHEIEFYL